MAEFTLEMMGADAKSAPVPMPEGANDDPMRVTREEVHAKILEMRARISRACDYLAEAARAGGEDDEDGQWKVRRAMLVLSPATPAPEPSPWLRGDYDFLEDEE